MRPIDRHTKSLTAAGFARLLRRGIRANFAPENQDDEIRRLAEAFIDMAMSRGSDAEFSELDGQRRKAEEDADWLDAIAAELDH